MSSAFDILQEATIFTNSDLQNANHPIRNRRRDKWKIH